MKDQLIKNILQRNIEIKNGINSEIKTGLVVQGGAMRGTYSMASLMALEEIGIGSAFDHVVGSSAGAINAAYLLANQAKMAVSVYLDDISNKNFIDFARVKKIVDIDFLVDGVLKKNKSINAEQVRLSHSILHVILSEVLSAKPFIVTNKDEDFNLMETIRATAAMPILYNKIIQINGRGFIDGGVTDAIPLLPAINQGCTDILVVLTRDPCFRRKPDGFLINMLKKFFLRNFPKELKEIILTEDREHFNKTMDILESPSNYYPNIRIGLIYPSELKLLVSRTTNDRDKLLKCALMARNDTRRFFNLKLMDDNPFV